MTCPCLPVPVFPKNSVVLRVVGADLADFKALLSVLKAEGKIIYPIYNKTTGQIHGLLTASIDHCLIAADVGTGASSKQQWPGVHPDRFEDTFDRTHLLASMLGGRGIYANLVPIYKTVNRRIRKSLELQIRKIVVSGNEVEVFVIVKYPPGGGAIPSELIYRARVAGSDNYFINEKIYNTPTGQQPLGTLPGPPVP